MKWKKNLTNTEVASLARLLQTWHIELDGDMVPLSERAAWDLAETVARRVRERGGLRNDQQ